MPFSQAQKMSREKVFDVNIHLTRDGTFKDYKRNLPCNFDTYNNFVDPSLEFVGGLIVGLPNVGTYSHKDLMQTSKKLNLPAFAAITNDCFTDLEGSLSALKKMGFHGVKFHERLLNIENSETHIVELARACKNNNLILAICTYQDETSIRCKDITMLSVLEEISSLGIKIILMHSGGFRFLDFYCFCVSRENILLDTSFTLKRYEDTNIITNIIKAINQGNHNIAFGSDFPDYNLSDYLRSFHKLRSCIESKQLRENFMYKNAMNFLELEF
jgi:hypothetical protein